jgi:hypothetical protein
MSKKLNTDQIRQELEGSAFFPNSRTEEDNAPSEPTKAPPRSQPKPTKRAPAKAVASTPRSQPAADASFDINTTPSEWEALRLTVPEVIALEDAWHELRRLLGRKLAKNDVLRCAIHHVVSDYAAHKQDSILYRMLKEKKT